MAGVSGIARAPARFGAARLPAVGPGLASGFGGASGGGWAAPGS